MKRVAAILRIIAILVLALMGAWLFALVSPAAAEPSVSLSLEYVYGNTSILNAPFDLYRVGTIGLGGGFELLPELEGRVDIHEDMGESDWARVAQQMATAFDAERVVPQESVLTDSTGHASFGAGSELTAGVYLIVGRDTKVNNDTYTTLPFLVSLPLWDEASETWIYDVVTQPKAEKHSPEPGPNTPDEPEPTIPTEPQTPWGPLPETGELLTYALSYAIIGLAVLTVYGRLKSHFKKS